MPRRRPLSVLPLILTTLFAAPTTALARSTGPIPNVVQLCDMPPSCNQAACHGDSPLNPGAALSTLELEGGGTKTSYSPSELVRFVLSVTDPDPSRLVFGFEAAVVTGCPTPSQAGTLVVTDPVNTQLKSEAGIDYIQHQEAGIIPDVPGTIEWTFEWRAPPTDVGPITFYWATNCADDSFTKRGDHIYIWKHTLEPETIPCPGRVETLEAVTAPCDPGAPGVPKVALTWGAVPDSTGYRIYQTDDPEILADPEPLGAAVAGEPDTPGACVEPQPAGVPVRFWTVVGKCADGSDGAN